jgi:hypothetical protein
LRRENTSASLGRLRSMLLIAPLLATGVIAAAVGLSSYRRRRPDQKYLRIGWAATHHVIAVALAVASVVILLMPETMFPQADGRSFFTPRSGMSLTTVMVAVILVPLTLLAGAVVTFTHRHPWPRDIILTLIWVVTAWLLWQYAAAWVSFVE